MPEAKKFDFELGASVETVLAQEKGLVLGRAEYLKDENRYFVRLKLADGRQTDEWYPESALVPATGE